MADLLTNLATYKLQLQQVEASLTTDSDNEELLKLKKDLQEVVELTEDLVSQSVSVDSAAPTEESDDPSGDAAAAAAASHTAPSATPATDWKCGDTCLAMWSEDEQYYEAQVEELLPDGTCTVTFQQYGNTDITQVSLLRSVDDNREENDASSSKKAKTKKDAQAAQREYRRKRQQKKAQRLKQLEEEKETDKNKWLNFNIKTFSKTNKGKVKKSIFCTPEHPKGRVGVGTCGVAGRPMTDYQMQPKYMAKH